MEQNKESIIHKDMIETKRKEVQQLEQEIQVMKQKLSRMITLNDLEHEMANVAKKRQENCYRRIDAENKTRELYRGEQMASIV
ncbi:hypothetical protein MBANPS3_002908 [Mucor bainieri]